MKNFIRKYPKMIITAFLVVLLIAIVGTVNNYPTYFGGPNNETARLRTVNYLEEIYGAGTIFYAEDVPTWYADEMHYSGVYYKAAEDRYIYLNGKGEGKRGDYAATINTDKDRYSHDDTVSVKIEQYGEGKLEFDSEEYVLEVVQNGIWYCVHTGEIGEAAAGELIELNQGESWEFSFDLSKVREVSDEPIKLKKGRYRLSKRAALKRAIPYGEGKEINRVGKIIISCEFEIR